MFLVDSGVSSASTDPELSRKYFFILQMEWSKKIKFEIKYRSPVWWTSGAQGQNSISVDTA